MDWYYDRYGQPAFVVADGERFVSRNGRNLGWLREFQVYSLTGQAIGWFEKGVLRDTGGAIVAFSREAVRWLPSVPGMSGPPGTPSIPGPPAKPGFTGTVSRPSDGGWGTRSVREFFGTDL